MNAPLPPTASLLEACSYSEAAYFDGAPVAHCAAWQENARLRRIAAQCRRAFEQRRQPDRVD